MAEKSLQETITWYQTILKFAGGSPSLSVDGKYGKNTKVALKHFQKISGLTVNGKVDVPTNAALNQVAMEWLDHAELANPLGKKQLPLRNRLKKFQKENGLGQDGRVGPDTREAMTKALQSELPIGPSGGSGWKLVSAARSNVS